MKKMMLVAAACAMVAAPSALLADTVTSVNVVGYYSVTIPSNGVAFVTPVLEAMQGGTIADLIGDQLPNDTFVYLWDRVEKTGYLSGTKSSRDGWIGAATTNILLRGDAIWLVPPKNSGAHTVTFMGEVPSESNLASTSTIWQIEAADAVGYSYPVDVLWTNTTLSSALPDNSFLYIWRLDSQDGYNAFSKSSRDGWIGASSLTIKAGEAFWVVLPPAATPVDWVEEIPYNL